MRTLEQILEDAESADEVGTEISSLVREAIEVALSEVGRQVQEEAKRSTLEIVSLKDDLIKAINLVIQLGEYARHPEYPQGDPPVYRESLQWLEEMKRRYTP